MFHIHLDLFAWFGKHYKMTYHPSKGFDSTIELRGVESLDIGEWYRFYLTWIRLW